MITIGAVFGEPEQKDSLIDRIITAAMRAAKKLRVPWESGKSPGLNVVFYVPGRITSPNWEGVRDGKFSAKQKLLMVQVAVPEETAISTDAKSFIIDALHRANTIALRVFHKKGIEFPIAEADALVDRIEEEL